MIIKCALCPATFEQNCAKHKYCKACSKIAKAKRQRGYRERDKKVDRAVHRHRPKMQIKPSTLAEDALTATLNGMTYAKYINARDIERGVI